MSEELSPDDEAFLNDLETLFEAESPERLPREYEAALKRQTHDRLKPEEVRLPEVAVLTLIALVVLGLGGIDIWAPTNLMVIGPALVAYLVAALALGAGGRRGGGGED